MSIEIIGMVGTQEVSESRAGHDRRYARTAEFMRVLHRELTADEPFAFDGEFYQVRGAFSGRAPSARSTTSGCGTA